MKQILTILLCLVCSLSYGQGHDTVNANPNHMVYSKGVSAFGQELIIPFDTIGSSFWSKKGAVAIKAGLFFYNTGTGWVTPSGGGGSGANTSLSNISATSVNDDIIPDANNTRALGTSLLAWKNIFLPFDAGTDADPVISFYDAIHDTKIGIKTENSFGGAMFIVGNGSKDVMVIDNGHTPSLWAGRTEEGLSSFATYYEISGLQGISDGNINNGSNCALGLTTVPSLPGVSKPQYGVALSSAKTTDNTPTQIDQRAIGVNASTLFIWTIVGRRTGGSAGSDGDSFYGVYRGMYKYVAGNMVLVGTMHSEVEKDNVNLSVDFQLTDNNVTVSVIGDTDNEYQWSNVVTMQQIK